MEAEYCELLNPGIFRSDSYETDVAGWLGAGPWVLL